MSAYVTRPAILRDDQIAAERVAVGHVSTNAFAVIRQRPLIGREFRDDEAQGSAAVIILAADLWKSRYGADPHVVGRLVRLDGVPVTIIGVIGQCARVFSRHSCPR